MNRRQFLTTVGTISLAAWTPIPKWLGDPAGGFYRPLPHDFDHLIDWKESIAAGVQHAFLGAVWAPPGSSYGQLQMFVGVIQVDPDPKQYARQRENMRESLRSLVEMAHEPGWFQVREEDKNVWKRIGYLEWVKPSQFERQAIYLLDGAA